LVFADNILIAPLQNHFLVFDPRLGQMTVLDPQAYHLAEQFQTPRRLTDVLAQMDSAAAETTWQTLGQLMTLGLLTPADARTDLALHPSDTDALIAWLHLTNQCNLNCRYCYVNRSAACMEERTASLALRTLFETAAAGGYARIVLKYAGGEPTLQPDLLMRAHRRAVVLAERHQLDLEGVILTNGVHIPNRLMAFAAEHGLKWGVSWDGFQTRAVNGKARCATHVWRSLERLQDSGATPHVIITLTSLNLAGLPEFVQFLLERQWSFSFNFYRQVPGRSSADGLRPSNHDLIRTLRAVYRVIEQNLPAYSLLSLLLDRVNLQAPHIRPCTAGRHYFTIGHQGILAPCQMFVSQAAEARLGPECLNLTDVQFKDFSNPTVFEKAGCGEQCPWRYFCAGGCPIEALAAFGRYDAPSPYCEIYRTLAPEVLRLEALRLLAHARPLDRRHGFTFKERFTMPAGRAGVSMGTRAISTN
jgi:uncharacterized protein